MGYIVIAQSKVDNGDTYQVCCCWWWCWGEFCYLFLEVEKNGNMYPSTILYAAKFCTVFSLPLLFMRTSPKFQMVQISTQKEVKHIIKDTFHVQISTSFYIHNSAHDLVWVRKYGTNMNIYISIQ